MKSVGEWRSSKGGYVYQFDTNSTARIDENGVFVLNYFTRTELPVNCSSTYRRLLPKLREFFYGLDNDRRLVIVEPLSMSRQLYITNIQHYCPVKSEQALLNNDLMSQIESLIKESLVFYSIEEYNELKRLKHNEDMRIIQQSKRQDDYCA